MSTEEPRFGRRAGDVPAGEGARDDQPVTSRSGATSMDEAGAVAPTPAGDGAPTTSGTSPAVTSVPVSDGPGPDGTPASGAGRGAGAAGDARTVSAGSGAPALGELAGASRTSSTPWPVMGELALGAADRGPAWGGLGAGPEAPASAGASSAGEPGPHVGAVPPTPAATGQGSGGPVRAEARPVGAAGSNPWAQAAPASAPGPVRPAPTKVPSRAPSVLTLIAGVVLAVVVAPIVFFATSFAGMDFQRMLAGTAPVSNGATVTVGEDRSLVVSSSSVDTYACRLTDAAGADHPMERSESVLTPVFVATNLDGGEYTLTCEGENIAELVALPFDADSLMSATAHGLGWGSLVGVIGIGLVIGGAVRLVRVNRARREARIDGLLGRS